MRMKKRSYKSHQHKVKDFFTFQKCSKVPGPLVFFHVTFASFSMDSKSASIAAFVDEYTN